MTSVSISIWRWTRRVCGVGKLHPNKIITNQFPNQTRTIITTTSIDSELHVLWTPLPQSDSNSYWKRGTKFTLLRSLTPSSPHGHYFI
ncbi:hypothetical protein PM082_003963 [Marasmius tenuissimus]|nr:hypothetical protein PM082_003963 [Marasmius tenuissimus]